MILIKMEMKENIYPRLPTVPPIEDQGQGYRLQKINEIQAFLEQEVVTREALSKKYFRATRIVDNVDTVLITITLGAGAGGVGLLSTVVAAPTGRKEKLWVGYRMIHCSNASVPQTNHLPGIFQVTHLPRYRVLSYQPL